MHRAAEHGYVQVIQALLSAGGNAALGVFDYISRTPLMCAVQNGHIEAAQLLVDAGSDVNATDQARAGDPALKIAVLDHNVEMVRLLLRARADPKVPGWMQVSALRAAAEWQDSRKPVLREIYELLDVATRRS